MPNDRTPALSPKLAKLSARLDVLEAHALAMAPASNSKSSRIGNGDPPIAGEASAREEAAADVPEPAEGERPATWDDPGTWDDGGAWDDDTVGDEPDDT